MKQHQKSFLQVRKATSFGAHLTQQLNHEGEKLPREFTLVVWNIFKRHGVEIFDNDICDLAHRSDILCLQEVLASKQLDLPQELWTLNHNYSTSYHRPDGFTEGVLTASGYPIHKQGQALLSLRREPVTRTPKATVISLMPTACGQNLLLINLHMLLFKRRSVFKLELEQILAACERYSHLPAVFCGDFNTFTRSQLRLLDEILGAAGFERCRPFHKPRTRRYLDHIYIRGLHLLEMEIIDTISSSDHSPLICRVALASGL
ncbi:endonuclease/exonuclease/phosphatase family protein [Pseudomaricurvus sp.]|uniref:endonuclease/exonuclease/phosphatase family protein n=1 Tax=Pseudomaricurvus sp. TaxID=2004510 RepID=UPI003F6D7B57